MVRDLHKISKDTYFCKNMLNVVECRFSIIFITNISFYIPLVNQAASTKSRIRAYENIKLLLNDTKLIRNCITYTK